MTQTNKFPTLVPFATVNLFVLQLYMYFKLISLGQTRAPLEHLIHLYPQQRRSSHPQTVIKLNYT